MKVLINLVLIFIFVSLATGQEAKSTSQRSLGTGSDDKLVNLILDGNGKLHLGGGWIERASGASETYFQKNLVNRAQSHEPPDSGSTLKIRS